MNKKLFVIVSVSILLAVGGLGSESTRTIIVQGGGSGTDARVDNMTNGNCSAGNFILGFDNVTGDKYCDAPAGSGDITAVYGDGTYIGNGSASGDVYLNFSEAALNATIDARNGSGVGDGNNFTTNASVYGTTTKTLHLGLVGRDNVSVSWSDYDSTIADTTCDGQTCDVTNTGTLDGYEGAQLIAENYTTQINFTGNGTTTKTLYLNLSDGTQLSSSFEDYDTTIPDTNESDNVAYILSSWINTTTVNSSIDARTDNISVSSFVTALNLTTTTYTGNLTNGSFSGYVAGNAICNQTFSGSYFCSESDIASFIMNNDIGGVSGDGWVIAGSPKYIPADVPVNDCNGWKHGAAGTYLGNYWHFDNATGGDGRALNCGSTFGLWCCTR